MLVATLITGSIIIGAIIAEKINLQKNPKRRKQQWNLHQKLSQIKQKQKFLQKKITDILKVLLWTKIVPLIMRSFIGRRFKAEILPIFFLDV